MAEEKRLFPAQEKSEKVLDIIRRHWFSYIIFWFLTVLMSAPLFVGMFFWIVNMATIPPIWGNIIVLVVSIYLLFILGLLIYGFVDFYLDVYIVTDRRIVDISQNGFFKRTISELNLRQIQDVNAEVNGFFSTLLHFGDVHIQTAGDVPNFIFLSIPHPYEISKRILDLHEAYLQKMEKDKKRDSLQASTEKTLTEKWFDKESEACYSDESCRQKILDGLDKHIKEEPTVFIDRHKSQNQDKEDELKVKKLTSNNKNLDQEGELSEGSQVKL